MTTTEKIITTANQTADVNAFTEKAMRFKKDELIEAAKSFAISVIRNSKTDICYDIYTTLRQTKVQEQSEAKQEQGIDKADMLKTLQEIYKSVTKEWHINTKAFQAAACEDLKDISPEMFKVLTDENYIKVVGADEGACVAFNVNKANELFKSLKPAKQQPAQNAQEQKNSSLTKEDVKFFYVFLKSNKCVYLPEKLHGDLTQYNGKFLTMKIGNAYRAARAALSRKYQCPTNQVKDIDIQRFLFAMVNGKFLKAVEIHDCTKYQNMPQYFITNVANVFMQQNGYCEGAFFTKPN